MEVLNSISAYKCRRQSSWKKNSSYWLQGPLRHVVDVGDYIADEVVNMANGLGADRPTIVDMGFGDAWLLRYLTARGLKFQYIGIDSNEDFIVNARKTYGMRSDCEFILADLEEPCDFNFKADIVVNAFSFFELANLEQGMINARGILKDNGRLFVSTIDKTYLILANSKTWEEFLSNLREYNELKGVKYFFQPIDLGDKASEFLEYPAVLYSLDDYLSAAKRLGFRLNAYKEHIFTAKAVPKIYVHFELIKD
jgi:2-polyprenyl-3-methyl-5-hydroxy-6-metoxy-1,4-benzoquinol methylase